MRNSSILFSILTLFLVTSLGAQTTPVQDTALINCTSNESCAADLPGQGKGCFRMTEDDLFSGEAQNPNQFLTLSDSQDKVDEDREANGIDVGDDDKDGLKDGSVCDSSSKCDSYFCDPTTKLCTEKKICRLADLGEAVSPGVGCEEGYIINPQGLCDLTEEDKRLLYMGLIEGEVDLKVSQNRCDMKRFQNDPVVKDIREKSIVSMKTLRAMEWLFSTSSLEEKDECMKVLPFMRDEIAKKYNEDRKRVLNNFNTEMAKIEKESQIIQNAKKGSEETVVIHNVPIKEKDLESRKSSGYDALMIMYRRNLLFQSYEKAMSEIIKVAGSKVGGLAEEMGNWKDKGKKWTVGGKEWTFKTAGKCRGKKGKRIKKRWANYYQVNATSTANAEIVNRQAITDYLILVSGDNKETVKSVVTKGPKATKFSQYFLIDPLMPGGKGSIDFEKFGTGKKGKRRLGASAYPELYKVFREKIVEFYKNMKGAGAPEGFVYEPEIISAEARGCMEKPADENCEAHTKFIDEMTDIAFAQFLAYSIHSKNSYTKYFPKSDNLRRKLLAKYEVDMQNVVKYYDTMDKARNDQTLCLEKSLNSVAEQFLGDTKGVEEGQIGEATAQGAPGSQGGGASGASINNTSGSSVSGGALVGKTNSGAAFGTPDEIRMGTTSGRFSSSGLLIDQATRLSFQPNLLSSGNTPASNSFTGSANISGAQGQFAARLEKMKKANATALRSFVDLKQKEKNTEEAFKNLNTTFGSSQNSQASQVASLNVNRSGDVGLDVVPENVQETAAVDLKRKTVELPSGGQGQLNSALPASSGNQGIGPSSASPSSVLSSTDIENMDENYQRTKNQYKSEESDELFEKVSKAYVRNLDRVLIKRKTGPEE